MTSPSKITPRGAQAFCVLALALTSLIVTPALSARDVPSLHPNARQLLSTGGLINNPNFTDLPIRTGWTLKGQYSSGVLKPNASSVEQRWPEISGYLGFSTASSATSKTTASQAISGLVMGQTYTFSFYLETPCLSRYAYVCTNTALLVTLDGATLWTSTNAVLTTSWTKYSATFIAAAKTQTVTFTAYSDPAVTNGKGAGWGWYFWLTDVTLYASAAITNSNFANKGAAWTIAGQYDTGNLSPAATSVEEVWPEPSGYLGFGTASDVATSTTASQAISNLVIGQAYTLSFYLEAPCLSLYTYVCTNTALLVTLDSATLWTSTNAELAITWAKYSVSFTATATTQTVTFRAYHDSAVINGKGAAWGWYFWLTDVTLAPGSV